MTSSITGTAPQFRQSLWFGHFEPRPLPPADPRVARNLLTVIMSPLQTSDSLHSLRNLLGAASPAFQAALQRPPALGLEMSQKERIPIIKIPQGEPPSLMIPKTEVLIVDLREILLAVGRAVAPPEGIPPAPDIFRITLRESQATYEFYDLREMALGLSFLFQIAVDLDGQGVDILRPGMEGGLLTPSDLLLFGVFRASGLRGLMEKLRQLSATGGALAVYPDSLWGPLAEPGERPDLPRTFLDDSFERIASWGRGPYRWETTPPRVSPEERKPLPQGREVETLFEMLRKWVPFINPSLLELIESGRLQIRKVPGGLRGAKLKISFLQYFGLPDPAPIAIEITPDLCRIPRISALVWVIAELASAAVPEEICRWFCRLDPEVGSNLAPKFVLEHLLYRHFCRAAWAWANFDSALSLTKAHFPFPQRSASTRMRNLLEKEGLAVLIERFWDLMEPSERNEIEGPFGRYAQAFCRAGGLPILIRHLRGEPIPQQELEALSRRADAFLEEECGPDRGRGLGRLGAWPDGGEDLAAVSLSRLRERVKLAARLFDGLIKPIKERETEIAQSIRRLRELLGQVERGKIQPEVAELAARLEEADSLVDLLGPLVVEANRVRKETRVRQEKARKTRVQLRAEVRAEALRLAEVNRTRDSEAAQRRREEEQRAADLARSRQEEERAAAEAREREEREGQETIWRRRSRSVVESRKMDLEKVIREMEAIVLDLADKGLLDLEVIDREEARLTLGGTERTLRLPLWWRRRLKEILEAFEMAYQRPPSEERATEPAMEEMIRLCDEIRHGPLFHTIDAETGAIGLKTNCE